MKTSVIPALVAGLLVSGAVQAAVIQGPTNPGNDCGAGGFAACNATTTGTNMNGSAGPGSPVIFKRNSSGDDDQPTGSTDLGGFPTVTGSEFNITYDAVDKILSFTYTPGAGDPEIHYFTIKQANAYVLFYDLTNPITNYSIDLADLFGRQAGWSHITFFDTGGVTPPPTPGVPEPASLALFGLGLAGLGAAMRRRRQAG